MFTIGGIYIDTGGWIWSLSVAVIVFFVLQKRLLPNFILPKYRISRVTHVQSLLLGVIVLCLLLLPLDIQIVTGKHTVDTQKQRLIILLDVSLSMTADDVVPSRFDVAKDLIDTLVDTLDHTEIALVAFSGLPIVDIPFTHDTVAFLSHVGDLALADFPPTSLFVGTALGDALLVASDMIVDEQPTSVLLITDGDNSQGLHPLRVMDDFKERGIRVHTFAIGSETYEVGIDSLGNDVFAYIDVDLLEEIAQVTEGIFLHITPDVGKETIPPMIQNALVASQNITLVEQKQPINEGLRRILLSVLIFYFMMKMSILVRLRKLFD